MSKNKPRANTLDKQIGCNIKLYRNLKSVSLQTIALHLNVSIQQIQKYERALNRISASKLYLLANLLKVPLKSFYEGVSELEEFKQLCIHSVDATDETNAFAILSTISKIKDPANKDKMLKIARLFQDQD